MTLERLSPSDSRALGKKIHPQKTIRQLIERILNLIILVALALLSDLCSLFNNTFLCVSEAL